MEQLFEAQHHSVCCDEFLLPVMDTLNVVAAGTHRRLSEVVEVARVSSQVIASRSERCRRSDLAAPAGDRPLSPLVGSSETAVTHSHVKVDLKRIARSLEALSTGRASITSAEKRFVLAFPAFAAHE